MHVCVCACVCACVCVCVCIGIAPHIWNVWTQNYITLRHESKHIHVHFGIRYIPPITALFLLEQE